MPPTAACRNASRSIRCPQEPWQHHLGHHRTVNDQHGCSRETLPYNAVALKVLHPFTLTVVQLHNAPVQERWANAQRARPTPPNPPTVACNPVVSQLLHFEHVPLYDPSDMLMNPMNTASLTTVRTA